MLAMRSGSTAFDKAIIEYLGSVRKANCVLLSRTPPILRHSCLFTTLDRALPPEATSNRALPPEATSQCLVDPLDPVAHGRFGRALQVRYAADICGEHDLRPVFQEGFQLACLQPELSQSLQPRKLETLLAHRPQV